MPRNRVTIRDVAARAGVSTATVSNVFSGNKPVNSDLRARVETAAAALAYQPDRAAAQLRSGQARVIGVLVPNLDDVFFTGLISRLEVMTRKDGYDVIVASSRDDVELEASRLRALLGWRPAGLVAVPCSDAIPALLEAEAGRLPIVLADRLSPRVARFDTVLIDNAAAGAVAVRHLIESGHHDILIAASNLSICPIRERVRGASELAASLGCPAPRVVELGTSPERGGDILIRWLEGNRAPTAILALTNVTTLAALSGLARAGIDIPDRCSLIGFDDYPWMSARKTPLTAIRQPLDDMVAAIWARLRLRMAEDDSPPQATVLSADLQLRRSVRNGGGPQAARTGDRGRSATQ